MNMIQVFRKELEQEALTTRQMLGRVPNDKYDWKPHPKSMSIKQLSTHIAELPGWAMLTINTDGLDFAVTPYNPKDINTTEELLDYFESTLREGLAVLVDESEGELGKTWTLSNGDQIYNQTSKAGMLRVTLNQIVHHRAQLGVYLRLLDVPIPRSYGPTADEPRF